MTTLERELAEKLGLVPKISEEKVSGEIAVQELSSVILRYEQKIEELDKARKRLDERYQVVEAVHDYVGMQNQINALSSVVEGLAQNLNTYLEREVEVVELEREALTRLNSRLNKG